LFPWFVPKQDFGCPTLSTITREEAEEEEEANDTFSADATILTNNNSILGLWFQK
jgi:hypothetical protein